MTPARLQTPVDLSFPMDPTISLRLQVIIDTATDVASSLKSSSVVIFLSSLFFQWNNCNWQKRIKSMFELRVYVFPVVMLAYVNILTISWWYYLQVLINLHFKLKQSEWSWIINLRSDKNSSDWQRMQVVCVNTL